MKGKKAEVIIVENQVELQKKIGHKLKKIRKELGYSNSDNFAYEKGLNRSQYGKYEAGSQDIRLSTLVKTINSMGLTFEQFFSNGLD